MPKTRQCTHSSSMDRIGIFLSGLCVFHCLATPVLLLLFPFFQFLEHGTHFHFWMFLVLVPVAAIAIVHGYRKHRRKSVAVGLILGIGFLLAGLADHDLEIPLTVVGSLLLFGTHFLNIRWGKQNDAPIIKQASTQRSFNSIRTPI